MGRKGRFYGVGVGPGDPELLTLKAVRVLREASVLCFPQSLGGEESMALSIVRGVVEVEGKALLPFPFSREHPSPTDAWLGALSRLLAYLEEGRDCAFLTVGDPLLYSTFVHVYELVRRERPDVEVEVVPGVSSVTAGAARAGVPLAVSREAVALIPGLYRLEDLPPALERFDTLVLLKVNRVMGEVLRLLRERGMQDKAVLVRRATTPCEEVMGLEEAVARGVADYFSLLLVRR